MTNLADIGPLTFGRPFSMRLFDRPRPAVLVTSHERSGTHFLMNSVAQAYGYCAIPWVDLDFTHFQMNFYDPETLATALTRLAERPLANVAKSHHAANFFAPAMKELAPRWRLLYIHRDPVETLISYWRFVSSVPGHGGPRVRDIVSFARAQPSGQMLRYQVRQWPSVLHRWAAHLQGWIKLAEAWPQAVGVVRYDALRDRPAETLAGLSGLLGTAPLNLAPLGGRQPQTAGGNKDDAAQGRTPPDPAALRAHCVETLGDLLPQLGY